MQTVSSYRTKLLPLTRAASFARCLAGNGNYTDVQILESGRTRNPEVRWFVNYTPRNVERQKSILQQAQDAREERAREQAGSYEFILSDCGRFHYCLNLKSGEVYETTVYGCDCPDATYNLPRTGLHCKHCLMLVRCISSEAEELEIERQIEEQREQEAAEEFARAGYEQAEREACDTHAKWCREMSEREKQMLSNLHNDFGGGDW